MVDISAKTWSNIGVSVINIHENDNASKTLFKLLCISDIAKRWDGKNNCDLIGKEIKGKFGVENMCDLTKQQIRKYKIDRARLFKNDNCYVRYDIEDISITIIMQCRLLDSKKQSNLELI